MARYITVFYSHLFTDEEGIAQRHLHSTIKLQGLDEIELNRFEKIYKQANWLTDWQPVLDLIKDGEDVFIMNTANRIILDNPNKYFKIFVPNVINLLVLHMQNNVAIVGLVGIKIFM